MKCASCSGVDRRTFLKFAVGGTAGMAFAPHLWSQETVAQVPTKSCILLWMGGGPSQLDTFDPKPGRKTGGEFQAIDTVVRGMRISEHLPTLAQQARHFSIVRSLTTNEAAHERGTALMHTGYAPIAGQPFASMGTVASFELARPTFPLPTYIAINPPEIPQCDVFGDAHLPFSVNDVHNPLPNVNSSGGPDRTVRRSMLLKEQNDGFEKGRDGREMEKVRESAKKAQDLMTTPLLRAFDINKESEEVRKRYGGDFGLKCLLARRLVEAGVPFVEIGLGGWDTHVNNFEAVKNLSGALDRGFGNLLKDLADRDLLKETLVLWAGEFGRTPEVNPQNGRDHWTKCWSVAVAGGGTQGGRVIGETDKDGMEIRNRPVPVQDFFATVYKCLGIDFEKKYVINTRKVKYAYNGTPVRELF